MDRVSAKWMDFGLCFGLDMNKLEAWERQYREDASRCWLEVMKHWLNAGGTDDYPATWEELLELLAFVGYREVAQDLGKALASSASP